MLKINLLHSVTERQAGVLDVVDHRVGSAGSRFLVLTLVVGFLTLAVIGWDVVSSRMAKAAAEQELQVQKEKEAQLQVVINWIEDLKQRVKTR